LERTVYVDLYFMINFSMDFLCLYLTSRFLSHRMALWRGLISAALGGIYANVALFLNVDRGVMLGIDILICVIICGIAFFSLSEWRRMPIYILVYTAISMVLGGFMTALFNLLNRTGIFEAIRDSDGDGISVWLFALLAAISAAITFFGGDLFKSRMSRHEIELEITHEGKSKRIRGMGDSGNLLRDPISGRPCIVVDGEELRGVLPTELIELSKKGKISGLDGLDRGFGRRIVMIPAETVSGGGMLIGFRADSIAIYIKGKRKEVDAVIALSNIKKTAEGNGALVPTCLLA